MHGLGLPLPRRLQQTVGIRDGGLADAALDVGVHLRAPRGPGYEMRGASRQTNHPYCLPRCGRRPSNWCDSRPASRGGDSFEM